MLRKTLLALGVAALFGLSLQAGGSGKAEAAASYFTVTQACGLDGVGVDTTVSWQGGSPAASQVYVDVSEYNNGWIQDSYASSGALSPNQSSFKWVSLLPNTAYYVRVNQLMYPGYWDGSWTYMFVTGPACYGAQTSTFSTPAYASTSTYSTPAYSLSPYSYAAPGSSYYLQTINPLGGSYSLQPIDAWVNYAQAQQYNPGVSPMYINCYPAPFMPGCHLP